MCNLGTGRKKPATILDPTNNIPRIFHHHAFNAETKFCAKVMKNDGYNTFG